MEQNKNKEKAIPDPVRENKDSTIIFKESTGELLQSNKIISINKEFDLDETLKEVNAEIRFLSEKQDESISKRDPELKSLLKDVDETSGNVSKKQEGLIDNILPKTVETNIKVEPNLPQSNKTDTKTETTLPQKVETDVKVESNLPQKINEKDQVIMEPEESSKINKEDQQESVTEDTDPTKAIQRTQDDKNEENNNFQEQQTRSTIKPSARQTQINQTKNIRFGIMSRGNERFLAVEVHDSSGQKKYYKVERRGRRLAYRMMHERALEERSKGGGGFRFEAFPNTNQQTNNPAQPVRSRIGGQATRLQANVQVNGENALGMQIELAQNSGTTPNIRFSQDSGGGTGTIQVKIAPGSKFRIDLENNTIEAI